MEGVYLPQEIIVRSLVFEELNNSAMNLLRGTTLNQIKLYIPTEFRWLAEYLMIIHTRRA